MRSGIGKTWKKKAITLTPVFFLFLFFFCTIFHAPSRIKYGLHGLHAPVFVYIIIIIIITLCVTYIFASIREFRFHLDEIIIPTIPFFSIFAFVSGTDDCSAILFPLYYYTNDNNNNLFRYTRTFRERNNDAKGREPFKKSIPIQARTRHYRLYIHIRMVTIIIWVCYHIRMVYTRLPTYLHYLGTKTLK